MGHSQRKDPSVLTQSPPWQDPGMISHSFKSAPDSDLPGPSGHNLSYSAGKKEHWIKQLAGQYRILIMQYL